MKSHSASPLNALRSAWTNKGLVYALVKRDVLGRYQGSILGLMWSFFHPILLLTTYTFVFSVVFKARWNSVASDSRFEFALVLFSGLLVYSVFAECVTRAPSLVLSNVNYVKKVVFPLDILPIVAMGSALFHMTINLCVWLVFYMFLFGPPTLGALLFPLLLVPLLLFTLGLSWILASLGVYLRDVSQIVGVLTTVLMFMSPIFYPASALPAAYQPIVLFSPLGMAIEHTRNALVWGRLPALHEFIIFFVFSAVVAIIGFAFFQKTRKGFADVV